LLLGGREARIVVRERTIRSIRDFLVLDGPVRQLAAGFFFAWCAAGIAGKIAGASG
jgi:hypothetical protein